jgi:nitrogenase molybdenum-iron protein NifN
LVEQMVEPTDAIDDEKVLLLPHVSLTPIEVEKIKEFIAGFGFEVLALPDLSTSLDGHLGEKQSALSSGGITVEEVRNLANAGLMISVGASMRSCAGALLKKNPFIRHHHFAHLNGLEATDALAALLLKESDREVPPARVIRWRKRLQDAMLDGHFSLGQTRFLVAGEPDHLAGLCQSLYEAGGKVRAAISTVDSPQLEEIRAEKVLVRDLEDAENLREEYDLLVTNFHGEALAHRCHKGLVVRGYPNWEQVGNQLKNDVLYEGGAYFLCEAASAAEKMHEEMG